MHRFMKPKAFNMNNMKSSNKFFIFSFLGDGWNSEWAPTKEQAIQQAIEKWGTSGLAVNVESFVETTPSSDATQSLMQTFY